MQEEQEIISIPQCFSRIGGAFCTLVLVTVALQLVISYVVATVAPALMEENAYLWIASLAPMYCVGVPVCAVLLRRVPAAQPEGQRLGVRAFFKWLLIAICVMYAGSLLGNGLMSVAQWFGEVPMDSVSDTITSSSPLSNLIAVVLLAPVIEEVLFRKLLIDRTKQFGDVVAIVMSAIVFGLYHGNFYQFFYATGVGTVLAYLYCRTGRLRYSIAIHMFINFMGSIAAPYIFDHVFSGPDDPVRMALSVAYVGVLLLCTLAGAALLLNSRRSLYLAPGACPLPRGTRLFTVCTNGGMIAYFLAIIGLFYLNLMA